MSITSYESVNLGSDWEQQGQALMVTYKCYEGTKILGDIVLRLVIEMNCFFIQR